tara:strand:+ start:774 stop:986 length:213 start_codon:yes stop_codon:yes gene_type:complete
METNVTLPRQKTMKVKCDCGKEVELKDSCNMYDSTIVTELSALCECEMLLCYRTYDLDEEELENIKGLLK